MAFEAGAGPQSRPNLSALESGKFGACKVSNFPEILRSELLDFQKSEEKGRDRKRAKKRVLSQNVRNLPKISESANVFSSMFSK